jgi:hypothetical protein
LQDVFRNWNSIAKWTAGAALMAAMLWGGILRPSSAAKPKEFDPQADSGHGSAEPAKDSHGGGHGSEAHAERKGPEKPNYAEIPLGPELEGFDLSVLRALHRVEDFRYELGDLRGVTLPPSRGIALSVVVEFGTQSGLAEISRKDSFVRTVIGESVGHFSAQELLTPAGKMRLKDSIVEELNSRLATAQVRRIYFTDFRVLALR